MAYDISKKNVIVQVYHTREMNSTVARLQPHTDIYIH